jgi:hypothetical protein
MCRWIVLPSGADASNEHQMLSVPHSGFLQRG